MMTQASTTFPCRRSFSVHVEMYSLGSNSRGRRSSFTASWRRMEGGSNVGGQKNLCGSPAVPDGGKAKDRSPGHEDEREETQAPRDVGGEDNARLERQYRREVDQRLVDDEQQEAERGQSDSAARASMPMHHHGGGLVDGPDRSFRRHGRGDRHRRPYRPREVRGRVSTARIAPPAFVSVDPAEGRAAVGTGVLRACDGRVRTAGVAIPSVVLGNVGELAAACGTLVLDLRDLAGGGRLLDDAHR